VSAQIGSVMNAERNDDVRRIAVLRANAIGDYILALPAIEAVRRAYPQATITLLGTRWHGAFLRDRPGPVDEVIELPPIRGVSRPDTEEGGAPDELFARLRARRFDLALQLHGGGRYSNPFIRRIGARLTAGLRTPDAVALDRWVPYVYYQHETLRYLEVAALVGAAAPGRLEPAVAVTEKDRAALAEAVGEPPRGLVAIHPGATDPRRRWPPERFAAVADRLDRPIVITGTGPERALAEAVAAAMRRPARTLVDELSLGALAALYARCDLVIANDTGPRHLAAAVGAPTVGVFWCGNLINAGPLTRTLHRPAISWTLHCPACGRSGMEWGAPDCGHQVSWVDDVTVDDVCAAATDLLR
jgi:ADP-heptose:LPS heptosyltransferase